jgi:hypothetical protein
MPIAKYHADLLKRYLLANLRQIAGGRPLVFLKRLYLIPVGSTEHKTLVRSHLRETARSDHQLQRCRPSPDPRRSWIWEYFEPIIHNAPPFFSSYESSDNIFDGRRGINQYGEANLH